MRMEPIKIQVEVSVDLSQATQQFIASCLGGVSTQKAPVTQQPTATQQKPAIQPATQQKPVAQPATQQKPVAQPAAQPAAKTIEDVRKVLASKVNDHRDEIKQKLNEFGAPSVTKLDPSKYAEMYQFLVSLA